VLIKGLEAYRATGAGLALPYYLGLLGDACTQSAIRVDAERALDEALSIADKTEERCNEAEIYRLKGDLAIEQGREPGVAESDYLRSIDIANRQQSKAWELRTTTSLARLYQRTNRRSEARERLGGVLASFTEGFGTADFRDAKAVFGQLEPA
jgi:predicted ATPase